MNDQLLDFYFGNSSEEMRLEIEALLLSSPTHLIEFLAIKRQLETVADEDLRPSPGLKHRLRADVALLFSEKRRWVPALAAAAAFFFALSYYVLRQSQSHISGSTILNSRPASPPGLVDSSRGATDSLNIL